MTKNKDRSRLRDRERKIGRQSNEKKSGKPILQQKHSEKTDDRQRKRHSFTIYEQQLHINDTQKKSTYMCMVDIALKLQR